MNVRKIIGFACLAMGVFDLGYAYWLYDMSAYVQDVADVQAAAARHATFGALWMIAGIAGLRSAARSARSDPGHKATHR
jgi:hypothetical protein